MSTENLRGTENSTVIVMPESDDRTLCLSFHGTIKAQDHQSALRHGLEKILQKHESYNLLVYYAPDYVGWEPEAADSSMKTIIDFGQKARKLAYVNPPEKKIMAHKLIPNMFSGETQNFSADHLKQAIEWVKL